MTHEERMKLAEENRFLGKFVFRQMRLGKHPMADDLIAEAEAAIVDAARMFDPDYGTKFSTYACVTARRRIQSRLKQLSRRERNRSENVARYAHDLERKAEAMQRDALLADELADAVRQALLALPDRDREIVVLCVIDRRPLSEAGERFGVTKERARQIKNQALETLRRDGKLLALRA